MFVAQVKYKRLVMEEEPLFFAHFTELFPKQFTLNDFVANMHKSKSNTNLQTLN